MNHRIAALAALLGCAESPPEVIASQPTPTSTALTPTSTTPPTETLTQSSPPPCEGWKLREERAFEPYLEPGPWSEQDPMDTSAEEYSGSGLAVADFDGDGRLDLFLPDLDGSRLFLADGLGGWRDASANLDSEPALNGVGATAFDRDGDGDLDLYLARDGEPDQVLLNDGSGRFSVDPGFSPDPVRGVGSAWADVDGDGDLDGFVVRTGIATLRDTEDPNVLWRNDGALLVDAGPLPDEVTWGHTLVGALVDLEQDGDPDLVAVNDFGWILPNGAALNDGGTFSPALGTGLDVALNGMGLALGDLNADGLPDLVMTSWASYRALLSVSPGVWADATTDLGLISSAKDQFVAWSVELGDLDNDGDEDLYVAHGYIGGIGVGGEYPPLAQADEIFVNQDQHFLEASAAWGHLEDGVGRGAVLADLNDDGWLDVALRDKNGAPKIYIARCGQASWLRLSLSMPGGNPFAIGARVAVRSGEREWLRWVRAGGTGFASGGPPEVHVGLGDEELVDVEITWPDGVVTTEVGVPARQVLKIAR